MSILNIIKTIQTEKRLYQVAETEVGQILFYEFGNYVQYRNLTEQDVFWSIVNKYDFLVKFNGKAVETFLAVRLTGMEKVAQIKSGDFTYHLARKKQYDGYLYEINATMQKFYKHPKRKFTYTRYYEPALQTLDLLSLERFKIEETIKWNGHDNYDVSGINNIVSEVYRLAKDAPPFIAIMNPLAKRTTHPVELEQLSIFD